MNKLKLKNFSILFALVLGLFAFTSCSSDDDEVVYAEPSTVVGTYDVTLTLVAMGSEIPVDGDYQVTISKKDEKQVTISSPGFAWTTYTFPAFEMVSEVTADGDNYAFKGETSGIGTSEKSGDITIAVEMTGLANASNDYLAMEYATTIEGMPMPLTLKIATKE